MVEETDVYSDDEGEQPRDLFILEIPINKDPIIVAIGSKQFEKMVVAMAGRALRYWAESSFSLFIKDNKLFFGEIVYGTRQAENEQDLGFGLRPDMAKVGMDSYFDHDPESMFSYEPIPRNLAYIHMHPVDSGFSNQDMQIFENKKDEERREVRETMKLSGIERFSKKDLQHPFSWGLLSPKFIFSSRGKKELVELNLLIISGEPTSTRYQGENLDKLDIGKQAKLFEECGFRVLFKKLPNNGSKIDFAELH